MFLTNEVLIGQKIRENSDSQFVFGSGEQDASPQKEWNYNPQTCI